MDECCNGAIQAPGTLSLKADMAGDSLLDLTLCPDCLSLSLSLFSFSSQAASLKRSYNEITEDS